MTSIVLELILVIFLLVCAWRMRRSLRPPTVLTWAQIMGQIASGNRSLMTLSFGCVFSEGLETSSQDLWERIGGIHGLLWIYKNVGVLLTALDYIETNYAESVAHSPLLASTLHELRRDAGEIRLTALTLFVRQSVRQFLGDSGALLKVASGYSRFVSHLGLAIHDYAPELMPRYIPAISQS